LRRRPNSSILPEKNVPKRQAASGDASQSA
jgi:hypothetical protein